VSGAPLALREQLREVVAALRVCDPPPALIGGLALAAHGYVRATRDIDFLIAAEDADRADRALAALGYERVHRSQNAANYRRGDEGVDLLYASRPISRGLLSRALAVPGFGARVVSVEGIIGFKLQAHANAPDRPHDLADIRALVARHRDKLDRAETRRYFELFASEPLWRELFGDA
jgi:hypothetical protein